MPVFRRCRRGLNQVTRTTSSKTFSIEKLRRALLTFRETYNATWLIERHGFIAPAVFREKQLQTAALAA
jgi:hypothetical protein